MAIKFVMTRGERRDFYLFFALQSCLRAEEADEGEVYDLQESMEALTAINGRLNTNRANIVPVINFLLRPLIEPASPCFARSEVSIIFRSLLSARINFAHFAGSGFAFAPALLLHPKSNCCFAQKSFFFCSLCSFQ